VNRGALISDCGKYRYALFRQWDDSKRRLPFIMLNPSTADAETDDPTIRKCIGFAERLGFGGIQVFNLYAYRATKPAELRANGYQVGPQNDICMTTWLKLEKLDERGYVICAWGANARGLSRPEHVKSHLALAGVRLRALRLLPDGVPEHPLMLPYSCTPIPLGAPTGDKG
jgi:hypothetical protein